MATFAFASLVFLSWAAAGRAFLLGRMLSPMAEEYVDSDGLGSDVLAEAVVRTAMNHSHASVLLDPKQRNFIAAMLAKVTHELHVSTVGRANHKRVHHTVKKEGDDPQDVEREQTGDATSEETGNTNQEQTQSDTTASEDTGGDNQEQTQSDTTASEDTGGDNQEQTKSVTPASEDIVVESTGPSFEAILSCFFGPGLGTTNMVLDSINFLSAIQKQSAAEDTPGMLRVFIGFVGKFMGWGASIYNIEQPCGQLWREAKTDCASTESLFGLTPSKKNAPTFYARLIGTALVTTGALWGSMLQCKSGALGGKKLVDHTDWIYVVTKVTKAVKLSIDFGVESWASPGAGLCKKTAATLGSIAGAASSILKRVGSLKADKAIPEAGASSWCAADIAATAAQIPALVANYCGYLACENQR